MICRKVSFSLNVPIEQSACRMRWLIYMLVSLIINNVFQEDFADISGNHVTIFLRWYRKSIGIEQPSMKGSHLLIPFLVPPSLSLTTKTRHAVYTESNQPHYLRILFIRSKFHTKKLLPTNDTLWNQLSRRCIRDNYNLNFFMCWVNCYLSHISS